MSQQKNKKPVSPWIQCDKCATNILVRDSEIHTNDCPPNVQNISYGFVIDDVLYGTLDIKTNEDIKSLSSRDKDNLVFLSQAAIQLCLLSIGEWAIVSPVDKSISPVARIVWPTIEKTLTSVLFTKNGIDFSCFKPKQIVTVSKASENIQKAASISLIILNGPKSLEITSELNTRITKSHTGRLLTIGNHINVMFYGKNLQFEIKSIQGNANENNLEQNFGQLSVAEKNNEFFKAGESTKWKLYRDQESFIKETEEEKIYQVAGLDEEINELRETMFACLEATKLKKNFTQSRSVVLYGHSGTGKTTVAHALAKESKANIVTICAPDLYSKYSGSAEETIKELFKNAQDQAPSIIILDELDILCPVRSSRITDTEKRIVSTLLVMLDSLNELPNCRIFIIATTNKIDNVDPAFRRCGRLDREIEIPTPNPKARKSILGKMLEGLYTNLSESDLNEISMNTHGFVGADLVSLCSRANLTSVKRGESINLEDFKMALRKVRPSAMREVQVEVPNVKWADIGGQENLKLILRQAVEWPLKYSESFVRLGVTPPRGVLMFGPPGCSKTMIAKALATESGLNFLSIKGPELFSKWVGESERAIREVFRKARQVAPSIVFFDEIDALGGERSSGSSASVQERVLAQLLTELDGVTPLGDVTILAATNRPDKIDKALLRPGRLDRIVYVPLPDENTRREIFRIKLSKMPVLDVSIDDLVKKTLGYSGAEVNAICHEAAIMALEESLQIQHVENKHFEKALKLITPRTPQSLIQLYEDYMQVKI